MSASKWTVKDLPDLTGQTHVVTGGTSGIGLQAAKQLAARGAHVVLPSITRAEGDAAAREIGGSTEVHQLDLGNLEAIREFAESYDGEIDVLYDNAGLMSKARRETSDGFELHLGVNVLGPFLLTELLLPQITGRIVITSSMSHAAVTFDFDDPHFRERSYSMASAYAQSKLACLWWGLDLQRRLTDQGSDVLVQMAHPGFALTSILDLTPIDLINKTLAKVGSLFVPTAADGALPLLFGATADLPPASYVGPTGFRQIRGVPGICERSADAADADLAARFTTFAMAETGL